MSNLICDTVTSKTTSGVVEVAELVKAVADNETVQGHGIAVWTAGLTYPKSVVVWHENAVYQLKEAGSVEAPPHADWELLDVLALKQETAEKVDKSAVVQVEGTSESVVMSQKAVTEAIEEGAKTEIVNNLGDSETAVLSQKASTELLLALSGEGTLSSVYTGPYGLSWDQASDSYTRLGASGYTAIQSRMRRCVLNEDGTVNYFLNRFNSNFKEDGTPAVLTGADGNVQVQIPAFFVKFTMAGTVRNMEVSLTEEVGFERHPAFIKAGVPVDFRYAPAYRGALVAGKLRSVSGVAPTMSRSLPQFRLDCVANGAGWHLNDWHLYNAVKVLAFIEIGSLDTQKHLGNGNHTGTGYTRTTGLSNKIGNGNSSPADVGWMSYRGIEDFYGSSWQCLDGININNREVFVNGNHSSFASDVFSGDYVSTGVTIPLATEGYIKDMAFALEGILPTAVGGSSSTYATDALWSAAGAMSARVGGSAAYGLPDGASALYAILAASIAGSDYGAGLVF